MIRLRVNGKERTMDRPATVQRLLEELELNPAAVVVELNEEILDRERLSEVHVKDGDQLELVHFVGGG